MLFSPQQDAALCKINDWYTNHRQEQQVFRLFGCAGTGKSTLAKHIAEGIEGNVRFAAFTGKAAHVMAQKGCVGASTIHRLIYRPKMASKHRLTFLQEDLAQLKDAPEPDFEAIHQVEEELKLEQENTGRMNFSLNLESDLRFASLLIVDEVSMVSQMMGLDLLSFGVPILVLGDPEQLPPIMGTGYFTEQTPDTMLTEIHRQAKDNPIIRLATDVREGKILQRGNYGTSKVVDHQLDSEDLMDHDIILTGLRNTKHSCDKRVRTLLSHDHIYPICGDKIMCVKNNHNLGLLNGQIWEMASNSTQTGDGLISLHMRSTDTEEEMVVSAAEKLFLGQPLSRWEHEEDIEEFEYAYAATVHKAQGSQWGNVLLFDQKHKFPNWSERDRRRWLYTGITRAAEKITVMRL